MEEKKVVEVKKKSNSKKWLYLFVGIVVVLILLASCFVVFRCFVWGGFSKLSDSVSEWIENLDFDSGTTTITDSDDGNKTIVVTENEKNTITIVENSMPSVVSIAVTSVSLTQSGIVDESSNIGTGFIVDSTGIVVTNNHVVSDTSAEYKVVDYEGNEYSVAEILRDDTDDIAIVKIDNANNVKFTVIELGDSDNLKVGMNVIAIGTPLGEFAGSVTSGIISGLDRSVTTSSSSWYGTTSKSYDGVIQTDAAINSGNSGGPLINSEGEVVGISFATTSNADNISFAIPINKVKERLEEYRTYGKFMKSYLGVSYQMISEYYAMYYDNVVAGAYVVSVDSTGPAASAGIQKGDIITYFAGEAVTNSLSDMIQSKKVGDTVDITVYRNGEEIKLVATLAEAE